MREPFWLWASAALVILNISLPRRPENIRIHQGNSLWATKNHQHQAQQTRSSPGKLKMIACELQCFFGAKFTLNMEILMENWWSIRLGAGEDQQICYWMVRMDCALVLEPSQQPACHIALKNWGLRWQMLEGHTETEGNRTVSTKRCPDFKTLQIRSLPRYTLNMHYLLLWRNWRGIILFQSWLDALLQWCPMEWAS